MSMIHRTNRLLTVEPSFGVPHIFPGHIRCTSSSTATWSERVGCLFPLSLNQPV